MPGYRFPVSAETPLLLFFTDPTSGPARRMESLLEHLARNERERLEVKRTDVEKRPEAAAKMKVEVVPTLLLIKEKRVVARLEGRVSAPKIHQRMDPHLAGTIAA